MGTVRVTQVYGDTLTWGEYECGLGTVRVTVNSKVEDRHDMALLDMSGQSWPSVVLSLLHNFADDSRVPEEEGACSSSIRKTAEVRASTTTLFVKEKCEETTYQSICVNATTLAQS